MAKMELKGLKKTKRELRAHLDNIEDGTKALVEEAGNKTARLAKSRDPVDTGALRASIRHEHKRTPNSATSTVKAGVGLEEPWVAAFVEFGTGSRADPPEGLQDYAMQFFVSGQGNLPPSPYLFPSFEESKKQLIADLKKPGRTGRVPT